MNETIDYEETTTRIYRSRSYERGLDDLNSLNSLTTTTTLSQPFAVSKPPPDIRIHKPSIELPIQIEKTNLNHKKSQSVDSLLDRTKRVTQQQHNHTLALADRLIERLKRLAHRNKTRTPIKIREPIRYPFTSTVAASSRYNFNNSNNRPYYYNTITTTNNYNYQYYSYNYYKRHETY